MLHHEQAKFVGDSRGMQVRERLNDYDRDGLRTAAGTLIWQIMSN
jgi:hypothetical protein